jgi:SAM-dependent methyltransferase
MSYPGGGFSEAGIWQLVESDGYRVDLGIWSDLAEQTRGEVLDLGCGIGRVSNHLNQIGHRTTGVDRDPDLIEDFNRRRPPGSPAGIVADATSLQRPDSPLDGRSFPLVIAPQQLLQILGGPAQRSRLLGSLPELIDPGGLAAFAICEELPPGPVDYPDVPPDIREVGGWVHASQPVSIETGSGSVTAVRRRKSLGPDGEVRESRDSVTLERLDRLTLEAELLEAGMLMAGSATIPATTRHMGSTLVLARPATS